MDYSAALDRLNIIIELSQVSTNNKVLINFFTVIISFVVCKRRFHELILEKVKILLPLNQEFTWPPGNTNSTVCPYISDDEWAEFSTLFAFRKLFVGQIHYRRCSTVSRSRWLCLDVQYHS